jgi:hypothetical protein
MAADLSPSADAQLPSRAVLEACYSYAFNRWRTLTFNCQLIVNPGYNADRGPLSI